MDLGLELSVSSFVIIVCEYIAFATGQKTSPARSTVVSKPCLLLATDDT